MARNLSAQTGIDNSDTDYLNGKLVDGETLIGEGINQDIVQFFQYLMRSADLVANGNPDNTANDYQFVEALKDYINAQIRTRLGKVKYIEIGDWNMNSSGSGFTSKTIAHGLADHEKIRAYSVLIRNDAGTDLRDLHVETGTGVDGINSTNINLVANTGSFFDTATYSSTSINRGYIKIEYIV